MTPGSDPTPTVGTTNDISPDALARITIAVGRDCFEGDMTALARAWRSYSSVFAALATDDGGVSTIGPDGTQGGGTAS